VAQPARYTAAVPSTVIKHSLDVHRLGIEAVYVF
jgi:hypothetical protein